MTFFSILCALLLEQIRPLRADNIVYSLIKEWVGYIEYKCNTGEFIHGKLAWWLIVLTLTLPPAVVYGVIYHYVGFWAAFLWNILILYMTLGFRHYSNYFTAIELALENEDKKEAQKQLKAWTKTDTSKLSEADIVRLTIEYGLVTTHRNVFGVFFWFLVPIGPTGAIIYRVAEYLSRAWNGTGEATNEVFGQYAQRLFSWIDWIPARLTAIAFAIVGNFEEAIYAWRHCEHYWKEQSNGIILASGGGALGLRLGGSEEAVNVQQVDPALSELLVEMEAPPGEIPTLKSLQSMIGLVWRAMLLWLLLLFMLSAVLWVS